MIDHFWAALLVSLVAALLTTLGIIIARYSQYWIRQYISYFVSFASGLILTVSFIHLLPKAFMHNSTAPIFLLIGYLVMYFMSYFVQMALCPDGTASPEGVDMDDTNLSFGLIPLIGISFHSFVDGIIYAVTFTVSIFTGVLTALGMIVHEVVEGVLTFAFLMKSNFSIRKSFILAFCCAALSTPIGVLVSYPIIRHANQLALSNLLALAAGALIYVSATHLLPTVEKKGYQYNFASLLFGILVAVMITAVLHVD